MSWFNLIIWEVDNCTNISDASAVTFFLFSASYRPDKQFYRSSSLIENIQKRTMHLSTRAIASIIAAFSLIAACRKNTVVTLRPSSVNKLVSIDGIVFDTTKSNLLNAHVYAFDTLKQAYTLTSFGAFSGKTRTVKFSNGGGFQNVPVIKATGFNDYGSSYFARDTAGIVWDIYQLRFNTTGYLRPVPINIFAPKALQSGDYWYAWAGLEQGKNSQYYSFAAKVINSSAATSTGATGCIEIEYSAPDYKDTVFIKPGRGPVEIRSWRAHLYESNQPGFGGYK
ncbi:MAG: hypothetical protein INR73_26135 [Williamsia sp.]|nr:hypothetical protein [Williamsia sp.]